MAVQVHIIGPSRHLLCETEADRAALAETFGQPRPDQVHQPADAMCRAAGEIAAELLGVPVYVGECPCPLLAPSAYR